MRADGERHFSRRRSDLTGASSSEQDGAKGDGMSLIATIVLAVVGSVSVWAWRSLPGRKAADQFLHIWSLPWGKQLMLDFFGLEAMLALWMVTDAMSAGTWASAVICIAAMPIFGSMSAAAYWLLRAL
jgi:hypothetical protein